MGHSSPNSDIPRKHVGAWRYGWEHRQELAREACLRQISDGERLQWCMTRYSTVDTMQQIGEQK